MSAAASLDCAKRDSYTQTGELTAKISLVNSILMRLVWEIDQDTANQPLVHRENSEGAEGR